MKSAILLVAFGAASHEARAALAGFDGLVRATFPGYAVRWAYTSPVMRRRIAMVRRKSDSVGKAVLRLGFEGFGQLAIQPLQTIAGSEYSHVVAEARWAACVTGMELGLGEPMLASSAHAPRMARALLSHLPPQRQPHEHVVAMVHGGRHKAGVHYAELAREVQALDPGVHVASLSHGQDLAHVLPALASRRVWLVPLLSVVGRHVLRDMAGSDTLSWQTRIERAGHECCAVLRGMAGQPAFAQIWLDHLRACIGELAASPAVN